MRTPPEGIDMWGNKGIARLYLASVVAVMNDFCFDGSKGRFLGVEQGESALDSIFDTSASTDSLVYYIRSWYLKLFANPSMACRRTEKQKRERSR